LVIALSSKPLSMDTAYIPVVSNVAAKLKATPVSMIEGGVPSTVYEFNLTAKKTDTIALPVKTTGLPILSNLSAHPHEFSLSKVGSNNLLTLPSIYRNGKIQIVTSSGRVVGSTTLDASIQKDLSLWNVAAGIYLLNVIAPNGSSLAQKIQHTGGDFQISTSFTSTFTLGGALNQRVVTTASRASTAVYTFEITPIDANYGDSVHSIQLTSQLNPKQMYLLIDPNNPVSNLEMLMDSVTYVKFFPNRFGFGYGDYTTRELPSDPTQIYKLLSDGDYDYYTYESFAMAARKMAEIKVDLYVALDGNGKVQEGCSRIVWKNVKTGVNREFKTQATYDEAIQWGSEKFVGTIDYSKFCSEGSVSVQKQELAAFLGNISHETTAADVALVPEKTWGLYWREEVAWQNGSTSLGYVDQYPNALYPPTSGKSYHGRGPIQITHNVNYGQLSEFLYGDKKILLDNPDLLCPNKPEDATVAFMSAIWFWMTPQAPKPSCHDVMSGKWIPNSEDISANRDKSKFGMTVNVINGGLECNKPDSEKKVEDRAKYYQRYIGLLGEPAESDCDCSDMKYY